MVWPIRSKIGSLVRSTAALAGSSSIHGDSSWCLPFSGPTKSVGSSMTRPPPKSMKWAKTDGSHVAAFLPSVNNGRKLSREYNSLDVGNMVETRGGQDLFGLIKHRFLSFKKNKYTKELKHFQALAEAQFPKDGPSECNAALEFAVTTLKVENILVIGHSKCAGIETLMNMQEDVESRSFIHKWVANGKVAQLRTKAAAAHLSFSQQCKCCEKESINQSLLNLLTYPWIKDKVRKELVSLHGGYYNFLNCTFEKWTLDVREGGGYAVKDQEFWC